MESRELTPENLRIIADSLDQFDILLQKIDPTYGPLDENNEMQRDVRRWADEMEKK